MTCEVNDRRWEMTKSFVKVHFGKETSMIVDLQVMSAWTSQKFDEWKISTIKQYTYQASENFSLWSLYIKRFDK